MMRIAVAVSVLILTILTFTPFVIGMVRNDVAMIMQAYPNALSQIIGDILLLLWLLIGNAYLLTMIRRSPPVAFGLTALSIFGVLMVTYTLLAPDIMDWSVILHAMQLSVVFIFIPIVIAGDMVSQKMNQFLLQK